MRTLFCCGVVLSVVLAGTTSRDLFAQSPADDFVTLSLLITDSEELPAPPVGWRFYGEPRQLRFAFSVANSYTSKTPVLIDTDGIRKTVGLIVEREMEIPITIRWLEQMSLNSEPIARSSGSPWVRIEPRQQLEWSIIVERPDARAFETGRYYLTSGFSGVRSAVRNVDGSPWRGRVSEGIGQNVLVIQPPTSAAERVRMHEMAGSTALARRDLTRALTEYTQLLEIEPANVGAQLAMGSISLQAGRYREAIAWWERVAPNVRNSSNHAISLAMAYVGAGQDYKATEVLRAAGLSEERVASELAQARRAAAERPPAR